MFHKKRGLLQNSGVKLNDINFKVCISNGVGVMPFRGKSHVTPSEGSGILPVFVPPFLTKIVIFKDINFNFSLNVRTRMGPHITYAQDPSSNGLGFYKRFLRWKQIIPPTPARRANRGFHKKKRPFRKFRRQIKPYQFQSLYI